MRWTCSVRRARSNGGFCGRRCLSPLLPVECLAGSSSSGISFHLVSGGIAAHRDPLRPHVTAAIAHVVRRCGHPFFCSPVARLPISCFRAPAFFRRRRRSTLGWLRLACLGFFLFFCFSPAALFSSIEDDPGEFWSAYNYMILREREESGGLIVLIVRGLIIINVMVMIISVAIEQIQANKLGAVCSSVRGNWRQWLIVAVSDSEMYVVLSLFPLLLSLSCNL